MRTLYCADAGFDCKAVIREATDEEVLRQAAAHAQNVHGVSVTPELAESIQKLIKEEV
jgi:predicted small metal-binding protein